MPFYVCADIHARFFLSHLFLVASFKFMSSSHTLLGGVCVCAFLSCWAAALYSDAVIENHVAQVI